MQQPEIKSYESASALLGDLHPLLDQLGSAEGLISLAEAVGLLRVPEVRNLETLLTFLTAYKRELLLTVELPCIQKAYDHACGNQTRELIALDRAVDKLAVAPEFASASRRIGRWQLRRLRPLRYERVAQRYLKAVEDTRANGWHTLVFGLTLALYSVPVRQGLLNYAQYTLRGFVYGAATALALSETSCRELVQSFCEDIPARLETLLNGKNSSGLHSV